MAWLIDSLSVTCAFRCRSGFTHQYPACQNSVHSRMYGPSHVQSRLVDYIFIVWICHTLVQIAVSTWHIDDVFVGMQESVRACKALTSGAAIAMAHSLCAESVSFCVCWGRGSCELTDVTAMPSDTLAWAQTPGPSNGRGVSCHPICIPTGVAEQRVSGGRPCCTNGKLHGATSAAVSQLSPKLLSLFAMQFQAYPWS